MRAPIGIFDSGIGGLSVLDACVKLMPNENYIYVADLANMPYGDKPPELIRGYAEACAERLVGMGCKAIVIACNTATAVAADSVRARFPLLPVIGLEPAVKPCLAELGGGYALVLVTPATFASDRFKKLCEDARVLPVAAQGLAELIEQNVCRLDRIADKVTGYLEPYRDAEAVALGCSHYSFVRPVIERFYGGKVKIYDGSGGVAKRLRAALKEFGLMSDCERQGAVKLYRTEKSKETKKSKDKADP